MNPAIPFGALETVFLDAGNTLISMDFDWIQRELAAQGVQATALQIQRAEAASRPQVSAQIEKWRGTESEAAFEHYVAAVLGELPKEVFGSSEQQRVAAVALSAVLRQPGASDRLWSRLLPAVLAALAQLRDLGLRLAVVSNSDGTVERGLRRFGLEQYIEVFVDSAIAGAEKPDPRIFEQALRAMGAAPATTLHVGDMYHADVIGARAAGLHAVLLDPHGDWPEDTDCARCTDLSQLASLLRAMRA